MIKVYDSDYKFLKLLPSCRNIYTTETLSTGLKTLCFQVPCQDMFLDIIQEENYVETADYSYVIKELILEDNDFMTVYCSPNIEQLSGKLFPAFDVLEQSLPQAYTYCLSLGDWTLDYRSIKLDVVTYQLPRVSGYEMIEMLATENEQDLWFDTKNKTLRVYDRMGSEFGAFYSNELRLKRLTKQSSTYDYFTVLHPIGKNGLTIGIINNNRNFLEDFTYTNKYIERFMIDEDIAAPELLKAKAEKYLAENCMPKASYKLQLSELGKEVGLGDTIQLVDKLKRIKQKQRVVKIVRYPQEPERDNIEISNLQADFARDFVKQQKEMRKELDAIKKQLADVTRG
jgi:phage minor structural protein